MEFSIAQLVWCSVRLPVIHTPSRQARHRTGHDLVSRSIIVEKTARRKAIIDIKHTTGTAMSWFFEGNGQQIGFSVSENGVLSAYGRCSQSCEPGEDPTGIRGHMISVSASWRICTPANEEHEYDGIGPIGRGLKVFFEENGNKAAGRINFHPAASKQAALVNLSVLAPNEFAASAFTLLKAAMGNPSFRFIIVADFIGLSLEDVPINRIPKLSEFTDPDLLKRRAYFSRDISISVRTFD